MSKSERKLTAALRFCSGKRWHPAGIFNHAPVEMCRDNPPQPQDLCGISDFPEPQDRSNPILLQRVAYTTKAPESAQGPACVIRDKQKTKGRKMKKLLFIVVVATGLLCVPVQRSDAQITVGVGGVGVGFGYPGYRYGYYPYSSGYYPYGYYRPYPYYGYYSGRSYYNGHRYYRHHRHHNYYRY
jgi:hypothetical protein